MADSLSHLLPGEVKALEHLEARLASASRVAVLVLAAPVEARLELVLTKLAAQQNGRYLTKAEILDSLKNGAPLFGRDMQRRLTDIVLRQFVDRAIGQYGDSLVVIQVPATIWKMMAETDVTAPKRFLRGLIEWSSPSALVVSYSIGVDTSSLSLDALRELLGRHLVELDVSESERLYLEHQEEGRR